jgi:plasmid stabilization system protein ParE
MKYSLILSQLASDDLTDIIGWYKNQEVKGLDKRFIEALSNVLKRIETNPQLFPLIHPPYIRKSLLRIFPYKVLYYVDDKTKEVHIIAVVHQSRDPKIWKSRI